ncbi:MAG: PAS domain S-box protein, partial [Deltaproteobacteria bacterium]
GLIRGFNRGAEAMLGYSAAEVVGKHTPLLLYEESSLRQLEERAKGRIGSAAPGFSLLVTEASRGTVEQREVNYRRKDGLLVPVLLSITAVRNQAGEIVSFIGVATDISKQHATTQALLDAKQAAERANRLRSSFFAQMSHEIRTPLNGILGMTDLLLDTQLSAEQRRFASIIGSSGQSLMGLINDVLDLSKLEAGKLVLEDLQFDPVAVLESQTEIFVGRAREKGLVLITEVDPQVGRCLRGDPSRIGQVLLNLVSNAVKFTDAGLVRVCLQRAAGDGRHELLRFVVDDCGPGLSEQALAGLFQPFMQADASTARKYGGTGLGLTICSQLVGLWGGQIAAQNRP